MPATVNMFILCKFPRGSYYHSSVVDTYACYVTDSVQRCPIIFFKSHQSDFLCHYPMGVAGNWVCPAPPLGQYKGLKGLTSTGSFGESPMVSCLWCSQWVCSSLKATWDFKGIFVNSRLRGVGVLPLCQTIPPSFFTFCLLLGILPG